MILHYSVCAVNVLNLTDDTTKQQVLDDEKLNYKQYQTIRLNQDGMCVLIIVVMLTDRRLWPFNYNV